MPIDDLAGGVIQSTGRFFVYMLVNILLENNILLDWKISFRIITLGKYPPKPDKEPCEGCVQAFGLLIFVAVAVD